MHIPIKSLLIGMLACSAMVACTNTDEPENNGNEIQKDGDKFVAVNIVMSGDAKSRTTGDFIEGSAEETAVNDAVFLFLDGEYKGCADPCYVDGDKLKQWSTNVTDPANGGHLISQAVLVINNDKQIPSYLVAILNPVDGEKHGYTANTSLQDLKDEQADYTSYITSNFVMSNSVYVDPATNKEVAATPITLDNIFSTTGEGNDDEGALDHPVTIPVERIVSKIEVTGLDTADDAWTDGDIKYNSGEDLTVKLVVTGWEVLQNKESYTIKNVSTAWTYDWWNDADIYRSYWASTDNISGGRTEYKVEEMNNMGAKYIEETVNQEANSQNRVLNPYLLVRGYFANEKGERIELVEWGGKKYTLQGYLNLIAGSAKVSQYWYKDGETYKKFDTTLLEMVDETNDWWSMAKLTTTAAAKTFYTLALKADGTPDASTAKAVTVAEDGTNPVVAAVEQFGKVQYWNRGNTYYYTPIQHQVDEDNKYYGIVRNHWYKINVSSIVGFGTPVANPDQAIDIPEDPETGATYLAAQVVVLKWREVAYDVTLGN